MTSRLTGVTVRLLEKSTEGLLATAGIDIKMELLLKKGIMYSTVPYNIP